MFDAHFGFKAPPFQLSPDPSFFFESKGHGQALRYLRYGVYQREGFIVVTGEIGSGKTTLVRMLIESLDAAEIVAAQVVSTQLDSCGLLLAICTAFGIRIEGDTKARLLATLEAFFTALAAAGRRALLIVDEAQNLSVEAIEELRMLSNYQLGNRALLQSFLVGQPELRKKLAGAEMEQLRQRILASCHLGALSPDETRAYIEHRLRHVGWSGRPAVGGEAVGEIHRRTGGIPRRINLLCGRLLLAAWLGGRDRLERDDVVRAAVELMEESGVRDAVRPGA